MPRKRPVQLRLDLTVEELRRVLGDLQKVSEALRAVGDEYPGTQAGTKAGELLKQIPVVTVPAVDPLDDSMTQPMKTMRQ